MHMRAPLAGLLPASRILGAVMRSASDLEGSDVSWSSASIADTVNVQRAERARILADIHDSADDVAKAGGPPCAAFIESQLDCCFSQVSGATTMCRRLRLCCEPVEQLCRKQHSGKMAYAFI